jgi:CRISPR-associated Csx2 family protein
MARKVFLSFLGTSNYQSSKYFIEGKEPIETRFVQIASFKFHCYDFVDSDKIYIFTTPSAKKQNWLDDFEFKVPCKEETVKLKGLKYSFEQINIKISDKNAIEIPEENSEEKIWETFDIIFKQIKPEDEIIFDITHGFRSSPMLLMVLINYAKFLKNIKIRKILYGAFEARNKEKNETKIWDLTNFSILQDWTNGANEIINFGNADKISEMTQKELLPILREAKGAYRTASALNNFAKNIKILANLIATNRGKDILEGQIFKNLNNNLSEIDNVFISPLEPIFEKLKISLLNFKEEENIVNAFSSVNWCINNNLVQQGFTILQEAITTFVCLKENIDYTKEFNREIVNSCFKISRDSLQENKWKGAVLKNLELSKKILRNDIVKALSKDFSSLTNLRNDINHAGFKETRIKNPDKFKTELKNIYCNVISKIFGELC